MTDVRLIVGPPGTGKTTALAEEVERAAAAQGASSVAICSLTRTAAAEIAGRTDVPEENVGTLHAHAYRALDRPKLAETPEGLRAWNEAYPELRLGGGRGSLDDVDGASGFDEGSTLADDLHQSIMNRRARMDLPLTMSQAEADYWQRWQDWKQQTGRFDFTDLIEVALRDVDFHPAGPATLLGDEAQDFSKLELALFRKWARGAERAVIAADPDQSIYGWRGADPHAFDRIDDEHTRILGQSYRVPQAVHAAASQWIAQIVGRREAPYLPRREEGELTALYNVGLRWPDAIADRAADLTGRGQSMMILTTCGYMLSPVLKALRAVGVPFHNPLRPERGPWNPMRGARRLAAFLRHDERVWGDEARAWTWDDLRTWTEPLSAREALTRGSKALIEEKCRDDRFGDSRAHESVSLEALASIFGTTAQRPLDHPAFRGDVDWWESMLRAPMRERMAYPLAVVRERGHAALVEQPQVIVGTIHSVKGGEADHVYLCPDLSKAAMWGGWHVGGEARDHIVRTFYVGMTRAREQLTVLAPSGPEHVPVEQLIGHPEAVAA